MLFPSMSVLGANDEIRMGIIGFNSKGAQHIEVFHGLENVSVVALCEVDQDIMNREVVKFQERGESVATHRDVRDLLDSADVDAVAIAAPDHWHALMTIWACQAGKDVYVEKPVSHSIWEGQKMVEAARKYDRIVQAGTQNRSDTGFQQAKEYIDEGNLGEILYARGVWYRRRESIGNAPGPQAVPQSVDYNLWTGPSALEPLKRKNLHYDWHWVWNTGTGETGNLGVHQIDDCRWVLGQNELPTRAIMLGGRYEFHDDGETPNTLVAIFDYEPAPLICDLRNLYHSTDDEYMDHVRNIRMGNIIQCEDGYFAGGRGGGTIYDNDDNLLADFPGDGGAGHQANFIEAVRNRDRSILQAEIQEGHISTVLCHMANMSYRGGMGAPPEAVRENLQGSGIGLDIVESMLGHLDLNQIDLVENPVTMGPWLSVNLQHEEVTGGESYHTTIAQSLYRRDYRAPFVVPEQV